MDEAYIRVLLTRGVGELTYDVASTPVPSLVIIAKPLDEPPARMFTDGIRVALVPILRNHPGSVNPIIKSNNLLNNALAMQEANRRGGGRGADVQLPRGAFGVLAVQLLHGSRRRRALRRPRTPGCSRGSHGRSCSTSDGTSASKSARTRCSPGTSRGADEAFITSTTRELSPVTRIDDRPVGAGKPGTDAPMQLRGHPSVRGSSRGRLEAPIELFTRRRHDQRPRGPIRGPLCPDRYWPGLW